MEEVKTIHWYHPQATRHIAESLLQNAQDGAYLLRDSSHEGDLALSVRCKDSVKHFNVTWMGDGYKFGMGVYATLKEFIDHFDNQPLIAGESGVLTRLKYPYPRDVEEPNMYETVRIHAEIGRTFSVQESPNFSLASKEGYLTKLGGLIKNWKTRWFVLQKYELRYYREKTDVEPIRRLDLTQCSMCSTTKEVKRENCFKLVFPYRTFYMYAATEDELKEWIKILRWKLEKLQKEEKESPPVGPEHVVIVA